ncbi:MAG: ribosomal protein S18-alanine N-acetyltransferase [Cellvibrionaceae bacterium]
MDFPYQDYHLSLQEMGLSDLSTILVIEEECHSHPWKEAHFISSIKSSHQCSILKDAQNIVGYAITSTAADEAELLNITIAKPYQQQGLGKQLLEYLCQSFEPSIGTLFLEVRESNVAAIALYDSLHFNEVGKRSNYYPVDTALTKAHSIKNREDAIIMAKTL